MLLFPKAADDLLDIASLPRTDRTELDYRTRPLTIWQEVRLTLLVILIPVPAVVVLAAVASCVVSLHPIVYSTAHLVGAGLLLWLAMRRLVGASVWSLTIAICLWYAGLTGGQLWSWLSQDRVVAHVLGFAAACVSSCLVARQVAAWILAGPGVDHEKMERWRVNLPGLVPHGFSLDCPELLTYCVAPFLIGPGWSLAAWLAEDVVGHFWLWPVCFVVVMHVIWIGWHCLACPFVPWPNLLHSWSMAVKAIRIFVTYNVHATPAAGVFRFPTRWLRHVGRRWILLVSVLLLLAFSYSESCPDPYQTFQERGIFLGQLLCNLVMVSVAAPMVLATILWWIGGTLLARFDTELPAPKSSDAATWDNYVDRIINSEDDREREHFLAGTSLVGDYPILVHRDILDQHMHILGDTGASKTSLGIGPLATQLIARGDSTVVIVDLKGDNSLFATCYREARRTRQLRFRWLTNEVGKTSFGFNPFLQTHNQQLSVGQFVQQLLQGLSLDYGIRYGAGYYTAMNEIVLTNVLRNAGVQSFRELDEKLRDQDWYQEVGGHGEDWKQARHLGALVSRLAGTESLNITPNMYPNQPEVHTEAIDATGLFEEPQVVYLSLRSALEPTNAPAIARLFLWSLFTAASHRPFEGHRVYFFLDEFQQVISDGIKLIFEQFRGLGGTIIAAHQTAGQLKRDGTDLGETVDSCTAVKQVFRASDLNSLERIEKLAGSHREKTEMWLQPHERVSGDLVERYDAIHAEDGLVRVQHDDRPRLDRSRLLKISSSRAANLVRFTFGSGYTQFAGATVPIVSQFPFSLDEYNERQGEDWPAAAGAFTIGAQPCPTPVSAVGAPPPTSGEANADGEIDFVDEFEQRSREPENSDP